MAYSKELKIKYVEIYAEYLGNISTSINKFNIKYAKELDGQQMTRRTYYNWKDNAEPLLADGSSFADLLSDADNVTIDNADFFLKAQTGKNNLKAICFYLKHRHPEYRQKIDVNTGERAEANKEIEELKQMFDYALSKPSQPVGSEQEGVEELARLRSSEGGDTASAEPRTAEDTSAETPSDK